MAETQLFKLPDDPTPGEEEAFRLGALFGLFALTVRRDAARAHARDYVGRLVERGVWHEVIANSHMERGAENADRTIQRLLDTIERTSPESLLAQARAVTMVNGHARMPDTGVFHEVGDVPHTVGPVDEAGGAPAVQGRGNERERLGLVLACQEIARLRMQLVAEETGEDACCEENIRLGGADEMRQIMSRIDQGEMPV